MRSFIFSPMRLLLSALNHYNINMNYISLIENVIQHIEDSRRDLDLTLIAEEFYISKYFINRLFKAVTEQSLIKYYRNRRLEQAAEVLLNTKKNILQIAFDSGYNSQEAFSRAFKKGYGITPKEYKINREKQIVFDKIDILSRKLINYKNEVLPDYEIINLQKLYLVGKTYIIPFTSEHIKIHTIEKALEFAEQRQDFDKIYFLIFPRSPRNENFAFGIFGEKDKGNGNYKNLESFELPISKYVKINYKGNMEKSWDIVDRDVIKLMIIKNFEFNFQQINSFQIFERSWLQDKEFSFYLPLNI